MKSAKRLRTRAGMALTAVLLLSGMAGVARAQDTEAPTSKKFAIKLGAFLPTQNTLSTETGDVAWNVGVDYYPNFRFRPLNGDIVFGADFNFRSDKGKNFISVPFTANLLWALTPEGTRFPLYAGVGGGIYFINTAFTSGVTEPGLKLILGVDLSKTIFLEANYDYVSGFSNKLSTGLRADGISVSAGYRF